MGSGMRRDRKKIFLDGVEKVIGHVDSRMQPRELFHEGRMAVVAKISLYKQELTGFTALGNMPYGSLFARVLYHTVP